MSPPGPLFNWLCVASGVANVLAEAVTIRANQLAAVRGTPRRARRPLDALRVQTLQQQQHNDVREEGTSSKARATTTPSLDNAVTSNTVLRGESEESSNSESGSRSTQKQPIFSASKGVNQSAQPSLDSSPENSVTQPVVTREPDDVLVVVEPVKLELPSDPPVGIDPHPPPFLSEDQVRSDPSQTTNCGAEPTASAESSAAHCSSTAVLESSLIADRQALPLRRYVA